MHHGSELETPLMSGLKSVYVMKLLFPDFYAFILCTGTQVKRKLCWFYVLWL